VELPEQIVRFASDDGAGGAPTYCQVKAYVNLNHSPDAEKHVSDQKYKVVQGAKVIKFRLTRLENCALLISFPEVSEWLGLLEPSQLVADQISGGLGHDFS